MGNWNYVCCKDKLQEIRKYKNYLYFKENNKDAIDLKIINAAYTYLLVDNLESLIKPKESFSKQIENSILTVGIKDPFVIHFITNVPIDYKYGFFIKSGNNRIEICKKVGIEKVPCIVVNLSGNCYGGFDKKYIEGDILETKEDVKKLFCSSGRIRVTVRGGKIFNACIPKYGRCE